MTLTIPPTPLIGTAHQGGFIIASPMLTPTYTNIGLPGPPISIGAQISWLSQRGLIIANRNDAAHFLGHVNYYRFRGYLEEFIDHTTNPPRAFLAGTNFQDAVTLYDFDSRLRLLLLDAFNRIEVSIRAQWTYHLVYTGQGGQLAHLNRNLFSKGYFANLSNLHQTYQRHGKRNHGYDFPDCPTWAIAEIMSFGQLSRWYGDTDRAVQRRVAAHFGVDARVLRSVLRHLAPVRNICAHHERLWDRDFATKFPIPKRLGTNRNPGAYFNNVDPGKLYNALVITAYLTRVISNTNDWARSVADLMNRNPSVSQTRIGFISGWQNLPIWQ